VNPDAIAVAVPAGLGSEPAIATRVRTDERALAEIYATHHAFVWRSLARLGVAPSRLDDAVHDVFMVVAKRLAEYEGRATMRTWRFASAMRVAPAVRRDAAREQRGRDRLREVEPAPHQPHENVDAARMLEMLLDKLDDDQRAVFIMAELEGMTANEIAMATATKPATVYSRLRLAREALARHVARMKASQARAGERR
jgi:RNA polymerase sigma-70 factor (ECF subfamily)